jgi:hypothetical protein
MTKVRTFKQKLQLKIQMKKIGSLILVAFVFGCSPKFTKYEDAAKSWEPEVQQLEALDKSEKDPDNAILFIGSSSIRLWNNIAKDMTPYPVIRRGYGGAKFSDLIFYTDRLVYPHDFRALAVFVANDISNTPEDKSPEEILKLFKEVVRVVRVKNPEKPIFFIEITPTNSRWKVWNQTDKANELVKQYCESNRNLHFIETAESFMGEDGKPRTELFRNDQLHLKQIGYDIWAERIKDKLNQVLN